MKVLILNSGLGSRMGVLTSEHPKCMTEISVTETILSRQLRQIAAAGLEAIYNEQTGNKLMTFHLEDATAVDIAVMGEGVSLL